MGRILRRVAATLPELSEWTLCGVTYNPSSFVSMLHYCANLKAIRYESTSLDRIIAVEAHRAIVASDCRNN